MKEAIIYTSNTCSYCHEAKNFLADMDFKVEERNISEDPKLRQELINLGYRSVPVIITHGEIHVGFSDEIKRRLIAE